MIKEFAFSVKNRHYFGDANEITNWMGLSSDTFMSLYDYDDNIKEYYAKKKSLAGFDGLVYIPDEFILDVDGSNFEDAITKCRNLIDLLKEKKVPCKIYFSGTGFHLYISGDAFRWKPHKELHLKVKETLQMHGVFDYADPSVTDKIRIIRVPNTKNMKSRLWKVQVPEDWLYMTNAWELISKHAETAQKEFPVDMSCDPVFDLTADLEEEIPETKTVSQGRSPDPMNFPCISGMLESVPTGRRHTVALRLAAWFRWLYPEDVVRNVMESWRKQVTSKGSPFKEREMEGIVNGCYDGHNGEGYRYGCNDPIMDSYCKNTCKLYKSKKSQTAMTPTDMENALIDFYSNNTNPLNLGALYGKDFPIYPGEVVIIQAPPKSMKTMLLQNWVNALKRPTYFIEMEMSPRQMWSRFVMIENDWSEEQLKEHYSEMKNGMENKFDWLVVDYSSPYAFELEKRISMLPVKPEILVVDHMGLVRSRHRDSNMKIEEVSQALMEIAVKYNIIVLTVSEITKQAFYEGMNVASTKGSFRTAYNCNKLLSVTAMRDSESGLVSGLRVKCDANREKEHLDIKLTVKNARIYYDKETYESYDGGDVLPSYLKD